MREARKRLPHEPYVLSPAAEHDLHDIWEYIAQDSASAADRVIARIRDEIRSLAEMPTMGHHRDDLPDLTLRVWTVYSYLIVYRPESQPLEVIRVIHGMRDIPGIFAAEN